jgi:uncharacterized protein (TIGR02145 family)
MFALIELSATLMQAKEPQAKTIKIGRQVWMAENLDVEVKGSWYYNEDPTNAKMYGRLYTWDAAQKACPKGWHIPTDDEWTELSNTLGGEDVAAKFLKIGGNSGFNAPLGGFRDVGQFRFIDQYGGYWTSSSYDVKHAWYRYFTKKDDALTKTFFSKHYGFCVRCIKD